jgi:hypothetical protein
MVTLNGERNLEPWVRNSRLVRVLGGYEAGDPAPQVAGEREGGGGCRLGAGAHLVDGAASRWLRGRASRRWENMDQPVTPVKGPARKVLT